jgi:hypothetical protein
MVNYPSTNILISPLDDKNKKRLEEIKTFLENRGSSYSQNTDNLNRIEHHYFMGTSVVRISTLVKKADIKIVSLGEPYLSNLKKDIEQILDEK